MAQVLTNFRLDSDVKKEFDSVCKDIGISPSAAFTVFAKKVAREKRIPFELGIDPFYSESNMAALRRSAEQFREGKVVTKTIEELEAME